MLKQYFPTETSQTRNNNVDLFKTQLLQVVSVFLSKIRLPAEFTAGSRLKVGCVTSLLTLCGLLLTASKPKHSGLFYLKVNISMYIQSPWKCTLAQVGCIIIGNLLHSSEVVCS